MLCERVSISRCHWTISTMHLRCKGDAQFRRGDPEARETISTAEVSCRVVRGAVKAALGAWLRFEPHHHIRRASLV